MRLINVHTSQPLVEFDGDQTIIYNKYFSHEMRIMGISIPPGLRGVYQGKDCIRLKDAEFQKAFKEIYYLTSMNPEKFQWEE